jgi:hypothetical protein
MCQYTGLLPPPEQKSIFYRCFQLVQQLVLVLVQVKVLLVKLVLLGKMAELLWVQVKVKVKVLQVKVLQVKVLQVKVLQVKVLQVKVLRAKLKVWVLAKALLVRL